jgi:hypothetical protein
VSRHFSDLDSIFKFDALNDLWQLVLAFQSHLFFLRNALARGMPLREVAGFLCRSEADVSLSHLAPWNITTMETGATP